MLLPDFFGILKDGNAPTLAFLHWVCMSLSIVFKILLITLEALHGQTTSYIMDLLIPNEQQAEFKNLSGGLPFFIPSSHLISKSEPGFFSPWTTCRTPQISKNLWHPLLRSLRLIFRKAFHWFYPFYQHSLIFLCQLKKKKKRCVFILVLGHPLSSVSTGPRPPCLYPPSRARIHARRSLGHTRTNMAASVSPLRSSFRICSPLTFPRHCCRAKLRMHRKCESQRRHVHQTATR